METMSTINTRDIKPLEGHQVNIEGLEFMHKEDAKPTALVDVDEDEEFSYAEQRKIIHRIDRRLLVITGLMFCASIIDRTNMPNAAVAGMMLELRLDIGYRYSTATLVFFITYTLFQPPATVAIRKIGPRIWLPGLCFAWGIIMIGFGFIKSWVSLIPLRIMLGFLEAGYFPGSVYLISTYYTRFEVQKRYAFFYMIAVFCSGLSGILAFGLQHMDGVASYGGWRWIFIIEGIMTVVLSFLGLIFMVDFPDQISEKRFWGFLKPSEVQFVMRRINRDRGDAESEPFNFKLWAASGADLKIWGFALIFFALATSAYAIGFFLPIILRENMGYSVGESQYLSAPPYFAACIVMGLTAWAGDKYRIRGPLILLHAVLGLIGAPLLGWARQPSVRYFGTFLMCAGAQGGIPGVLTYQANNIRGHWKRAFCSATMIGLGGIGGVAGSLMFRSQDRPHYHPGIYGCIACNVLVIIIVIVNTIHFRQENSKADRGEKTLEGDPNFRYTI